MTTKDWWKVLLSFTVIIVVIGAFVTPLLQYRTVGAATSFLENRGYLVFSAAEYALLAKEATAQAAVANAEAAVINAEAAAAAAEETLGKLLLHNENEVFLYPESVNATVTFTAGTPTDTFGAWAEIIDSDTVTLSSKFAVNSGYIVEVTARDYSVADEIYIIELAYGEAKTIIGRVKIKSDWTYVLALKSNPVTPAGETIYYRMKAETASATLNVDFRYYYN